MTFKQQIVAFFKQRHSKKFYVTSISQLLIVLQIVLSALGYDNIITEALKDKVLAIADSVLSILALFGVVTDVTVKTKGGSN